MLPKMFPDFFFIFLPLFTFLPFSLFFLLFLLLYSNSVLEFQDVAEKWNILKFNLT